MAGIDVTASACQLSRSAPPSSVTQRLAMSAASDALLSRLLADGALPAAAPPLAAGELRFAGQTLSPGVAQLYRSERKRWVRSRNGGGSAGRWLRPLGAEWPSDVSIDDDDLRKQLVKLFELPPQHDMLKTERIPHHPRVSPSVEPFYIAPDDDRVALRGQRGLRATAPLSGGHLLGFLAGHLLTEAEWEQLKYPTAAGDVKQASGGPQALVAELALESYCHELTVPEHPKAPGYTGEEPDKLFLSSYGFGNVLSLVNDPRAVQRSGSPAPALRIDNCKFLELRLHGWPCIAVVTTLPVSVGEELLASYGELFWHYVADTEARLNVILNRVGAGGRSAAPAAPAAEMISEIQDEATTAPPAAAAREGSSCHTLQMSGTTPCTVALTPIGVAMGAHALRLPAAEALIVTGTTRGDDPAASLAPLLASGAWDGRLLAVTAARDAPPAHVVRLASLAARMDKKRKAAFVADCDGAAQAESGRRLCLLPPGRVADAVLSGVPTAAAVALPPGALIALVFAPSGRAAASATAQAGTASADTVAHRTSRGYAK